MSERRSQRETVEDDANDSGDAFLRAVARAPSRAPPTAFAGNDRYRVKGVVGQGGFGTVYDAVDVAHGGRVAVKVLKHLDPHHLVRFKREFRTLADVSHENLVRLDRLEQDGDSCWFAMELVDGVDFLTWVRGDLATRLRPALQQLVRGIAALHARGILHRDLKPSNILVDTAERKGRVVIVDFGLAQLLADDAGKGGGAVEGTPSYMAPEQFQGTASTASDWYALGVVLLEALSGQRAFDVPSQLLVDAKRRPPTVDATGLPPEHPLTPLCLQLLDPIAEARPDGAAVASALGVEADAADDLDADVDAVVGRDAELGRLQALWTSRRPAVALVSGPSGVGKSALLAEARARFLAAHKDGWWLDGRCFEEEAVPWKALDRVVDELVGHLLALPSRARRELLRDEAEADANEAFGEVGSAADVARLFPALLRLPEQRRPSSVSNVDAAEARHRGAVALRRLLVRVCATRPVVVVIDDLHWGDVDSVPLLDELWNDEPPALLLIGSVREGEASECLNALLPLLRRRAGRDLQLEEIALRDLAPEAAQAAAAAALSSTDPARVESIVRESGGRPFLIQQLARFSGEDGLRGHLRALPDDARRLLSVIAIAGHPLTRRIAREAMGDAQSGERGGEKGGSDVRAFGLLRARRLARVTRTSTTIACDVYHARIRDAVVDDLDADARVALHRRLADALELDHADPGLIARHWSAAGERRRARFHATRAGEAAMAALAFDVAAQHFQLAADSVDDDNEARSTLTLLRAEALALGGRGAEAGPLFLQESARAREPDRALHLRRRGVDALLLSGHVEEGVRHLKALMSDVHLRFPSSPPAAMATMLWTLLVLWWKGTFSLQQPTAEKQQQQQQKTAAADPQDALRADIAATAFRGLLPVEPAHAAHFAVAELYFARKIHDPRRVAVALARVGSSVLGPAPGKLAKLGGHFIDVAERATQTQTQAQTSAAGGDGVVGDDRTRGILAIDRGAHAFWSARWRAVVDEIDRGLALLRASGNAGHESNIANVVAIRALEELGEWGEARSRAERMWTDARARGDHYAQTSARLAIATELLVEGNLTEAREHAADIAAAWHRENFSVQEVYALRIALLADAIDGDHAAALAKLTSSWARLRAGMHLAIQASVIDLQGLRGLLAVGAGDAALARESAQALRKAGRVDAAAHAFALDAALAKDDAAKVAAEDAAIAGYDGCGMKARALAVRIAQKTRQGRSHDDEDRALAALGVSDVGAFVAAHVPGAPRVRR